MGSCQPLNDHAKVDQHPGKQAGSSIERTGLGRSLYWLSFLGYLVDIHHFDLINFQP